MFEELQLALMGVVSPERLFVLLDAQRLLNEIGVTAADEELQQIIGLQDGISDTQLLVGRVHDCLIYGVGGALREYGVVSRDDVTLGVMTALLRTVSQFEYYLIPETLVDLTHVDLSNEEIVASLVPLFTEVSEAEALDNLLSVRDSTVTRMQVVADELLVEVAGEPLDVERRDLRVARINQLLNHTQKIHPQITLGLAQAGVRMGQSLEALVSMEFEALEQLDLEPLAYELLGLTYFSNTPISDIPNTTMDIAGELTDDPAQQLKLKELINKAYHEFADVAEVTA